MEAQVKHTVTGHVAVITLNRPEKLNVWNPEMEAEVRRLMIAYGDDESVRVIVLTGSGKAFCAGIDVAALQSAATQSQADAASPTTKTVPEAGDFAQRYSYLLGIPKPIVCALNGAAAGVGLVLALYCDVRYAAEGTKLGAVFARRGLVAEHGIAWLLPRLIGLPRAMEWLLSGRAMLAREAQEIGLISAVLPGEGFHEHALAQASALAQNSSPRSMRIIKRQLYEACFQSLATATQVAEAEVAACRSTEDFREGVRHFIEKRPPRFTGR